jgi:hypothetical protein
MEICSAREASRIVLNIGDAEGSSRRKSTLKAGNLNSHS